MSPIPPEFFKIRNRLKYLSNILFDDNQIYNANYREDITNFLIVASNPSWEKAAVLIAEELWENLKIIIDKRYRIFEAIRENTNPIIDEVENEVWDDTTFEYKLIPFAFIKEEFKVMIGEKEWREMYKRIWPEITAYNELIQTIRKGFNWSSYDYLREGIAIALINFEIGKNEERFIDDPFSKESFVRLMTDPSLNTVDIKKLKIKMACNNYIAAFILKELHNENIITLDFKMIEELQVFYSKANTLFTANNLRKSFQGFVDLSRNTASEYYTLKHELIDQIRELHKIP
jgi:hypothetical protein